MDENFTIARGAAFLSDSKCLALPEQRLPALV